ncbi:MAG: c-type cytochrome [Nitrospirota bacterium]
MDCLNFFKLGFGGILVLMLGSLGACNLPEPPESTMTIPAEYVGVHMPEDWWNNESILNEGRQLYLGVSKPGVNCAQCHGETGEPVRTGALNFRNASAMREYSDSQLLWRISEGVPLSTMGAFKDKLSQDEIWKVIAFVSSLGMDGLRYDPGTKGWAPSGGGGHVPSTG